MFLDNTLKLQVDAKTEEGSKKAEKAIQANEALILLKAKQKQLNTSVIDTLKVSLQNKYNDEDELNIEAYGFPGDDPNLSMDDMIGIGAVLIEPYRAPAHCKVNAFLQVSSRILASHYPSTIAS